MKEVWEFRVVEEFAARLFAADEGQRLGDSIRRVRLSSKDPRLVEVGRLQREVDREQNRSFFHGWNVRRYYSSAELEAAEILQLLIGVFEPAGEECGTVYDESSACPVCAAGGEQVSELILDLRRTPKRWDIAATIAEELVVTQRFAELMVDAGITGIELRRVRHKARYQDDPVVLDRYRVGRQLLRQGQEKGVPYPSWGFWVWLNRAEQAPLVERLTNEHAEAMKIQEIWRPRQLPVWYQMILTSKPLSISSQTRFGINPFDEDENGQYRCPLGHVKGLTILSEAFVERDDWDGSDFVRTKEMVGLRRGLLRPRPLLLVSPKLWRLMRDNKMRGWKVEVAHLL